jgi:hypothetical protein
MLNAMKRRAGYPGVATLLAVWTVIGSLAYARHYLQDYSAATPPTRMVFEYLIWLTCFYPWVASPLSSFGWILWDPECEPF